MTKEEAAELSKEIQKAMKFTNDYGSLRPTGESLVKVLGLTEEQVKTARQDVLKSFPGLLAWKDKVKESLT